MAIWVAAAAAIITAAVSVKNARDQRKAAKKQQKIAEREQAVSNAQAALDRQRQIKQSIAAARVRRAEAESAGYSVGANNAGSAITGDTASAIGAARTQGAAQFGISQARNDFARAAYQPDETWNTVGAIAQAVGSIYGASAGGGASGGQA